MHSRNEQHSLPVLDQHGSLRSTLYRNFTMKESKDVIDCCPPEEGVLDCQGDRSATRATRALLQGAGAPGARADSRLSWHVGRLHVRRYCGADTARPVNCEPAPQGAQGSGTDSGHDRWPAHKLLHQSPGAGCLQRVGGSALAGLFFAQSYRLSSINDSL